MAVLFSPWGNQQFFDENGDPAVGWKINTYAAGSSTPLATYTDATGGVSQTNPIVLNTLGFPTNGQIWLTAGLAYKLVLTDAVGVIKKTEDNISGVQTSTSAVSQFQASGVTPTYVSATSFTMAGDQTSSFHVGRRLQFTVTAGTVYGTISTSAYGALTTVTVIMDGATILDSGLSAVNLSILTATSAALPVLNYGKSQTIASAATVDIGGAALNFIEISGTTTITSFGTTYNGPRFLRFAGALVLTHNATTLNLPGAANITTVAGDTAIAYPNAAGTGWNVVSYQRATGASVSTYTSTDQTITASGTLTLSHGLGVDPFAIEVVAKCLTAEYGYSIGDAVRIYGQLVTDGAGAYGYSLLSDATNIYLYYGSQANPILSNQKGTRALTTLTNANWRLVVRARP